MKRIATTAALIAIAAYFEWRLRGVYRRARNAILQSRTKQHLRSVLLLLAVAAGQV